MSAFTTGKPTGYRGKYPRRVREFWKRTDTGAWCAKANDATIFEMTALECRLLRDMSVLSRVSGSSNIGLDIDIIAEALGRIVAADHTGAIAENNTALASRSVKAGPIARSVSAVYRHYDEKFAQLSIAENMMSARIARALSDGHRGDEQSILDARNADERVTLPLAAWRNSPERVAAWDTTTDESSEQLAAELDDDTAVACANCDWTGFQSECEEYRDFWSRVEPGEIIPHGDCPECGAFCYAAKGDEPAFDPYGPGTRFEALQQSHTDLVAAAPELLTALEECIAVYETEIAGQHIRKAYHARIVIQGAKSTLRRAKAKAVQS